MYEFYHYLPVNDQTMHWGMYLTGVGRGIIPTKEQYPPRGHPTLYSFKYQRGRVLPEFQMVLITNGKGIFESKETGTITIEPNTFFILFPDIWHRYKPDEDTGWKERWFSFNGTFAHQLMDQGYLNPNNAIIHLQSNDTTLISIFDDFLDDVHNRSTDNSILKSLKTMALLSHIIEYTQKDANNNKKITKNEIQTNDILLNQALNIIWAHSHHPLSIDSILDQVPASRRTLERRFMDNLGHSIHDEIIECRLSRATRLLIETKIPIKAIAYLSGFKCLERMRCAFKKQFDISPFEYRKQRQL